MNEPSKTLFSQGIHEISATRKERVGCLRVLEDGRKFRYAKNGALALVAGAPTEAAAAVAFHVNLAVAAAAAVGSLSVTVTLGGTAATENQYKDGYLQINDADGEGHQYRIAGHPAQATTTGDLVVSLKDPIKVALTTSSKASLIYNMFSGVVVSTGTAVAPTGIPPVAVTAAYYFWSQTGGIACAAVTNAVALGQKLTNAASALLDVAAAHGPPIVGFTYGTAGVTGNFKPIFLTLD